MKKIILLISLLISSIALSQNTGIIEGTVKDISTANNDPMIFATVTLKETKQSITTGFRGGYFFKGLKSGTYTLVFNFLGYESVTKKVKIEDHKKLIVDAFLKQTTDIHVEAIQLTSK